MPAPPVSTVATPVYFKGLSGLRFLAAALVLIFHAEYVLPITPANRLTTFFTKNGNNAVTFFFVLSGFLITYLLIAECKRSHTIRIRVFYLKRVLRIWPVYYGILLVLWILPVAWLAPDSQLNLRLSPTDTVLVLLMLPNVASAFGQLGIVNHFWSIGVEEEFYGVWPLLVRYAYRQLPFLLVALIIGKAAFFAYSQTLADPQVPWVRLVNMTGFEKMAWGGLGAWWLHRQAGTLRPRWLFSTAGQVLMLGTLLYFLCTDTRVVTGAEQLLYERLFLGTFGQYVLLPLLFLYLIMNVSLNPKTIITTENRPLRYLGDLSYGFYMYHMFGIVAAGAAMNYLTRRVPLENPWLYKGVFYAVAFGFTTSLAALSYRYYERWFQRFRPR